MKNTKAPNVEDKDLRGKYNSVTSTIGLVLALYSVTLLPQIIVVQDYLVEPCKGSEEAICDSFESIQILFISQFLILFFGGLWVFFYSVALSSITKTKLNDTVEKDVQGNVEIRCPYCEQNLMVPSNHEGDARCPTCSMEFIVESKLRVTIENKSKTRHYPPKPTLPPSKPIEQPSAPPTGLDVTTTPESGLPE